MFGVKFISVLIGLLMLPSVCLASWSTADTQRQIAYGLLHTMDWMQTHEVSRNPDYRELNPILGPNPSEGRINTYFAATLVGHTVISYYLPDNYRRWWQFITIGFEAGVVGRNASMGIKIRF